MVSCSQVVLLRSSRRGHFFLDLLLEKVGQLRAGESLRKAGWMQTIEKDQGAFDETVLEVLGLEVLSLRKCHVAPGT